MAAILLLLECPSKGVGIFYSRYIPISMQSFIKIGVGSNATELEEKKRKIIIIIIIIIINRRNTIRSSHWNGKDLNKQKKYNKVSSHWNGKDLNKIWVVNFKHLYLCHFTLDFNR